MARSKRRWAVSLHDVAKWTLPSRWSVSSWPKAGCPHERQAVAATDMAAADQMLNFDVIAGLPCLATSQGERAPTGGRAKGVCRRHSLCELTCVMERTRALGDDRFGTPFALNGSEASKSRRCVVLIH